MSSASIIYGATLAWWYVSSILNNVYTKKLFQAGFQCPMLATSMGMAAQLVVLLGRFALTQSKGETGRWVQLAPVSLTQILGNVCHKAALMHTTIPVVHTIKSLTTGATAVLGYVMYGYRVPSVAAILMMSCGVGLALLTSMDVEWVGVRFAGVCVVADSARALVGKRVLQPNVVLSLVKVQLMSLIVFTPVAWYFEGTSFITHIEEDTLPCTYLALSVVGVASMELANFTFLTQTTPLSHSMLNSFRSLVLVASGAFFGSPITPRFLLGSTVAISGVAVHSYSAKRKVK